MADLSENSWHLAKNEVEQTFVNFEYLFWRTYYSWVMWQEDVQSCIADDTLTAPEIAILHVIRMRERPKSIYEIGRLLNRDDMPNIQYCAKKLVDLGYVKKLDLKQGPKKGVTYKITEKGIQNTDSFANVRNNVLMKLVNEHGATLGLADATKTLSVMKGVYEEGSRLTSFYRNEP